VYATRSMLGLLEPKELEILTVKLLNAIFEPLLPAQLFGRQGQAQHGIDVVVQAKDGRWIGAQDRRYLSTRLTAEKLAEDVRNAHAVEPPLDALIFVTTLSGDAKLLQLANSALLHGKTTVRIWFAPDVTEYLDQYGLAFHLLTFAHAKDLRAAYEYVTGQPLAVALPGAPPSASAAARDLYALLDAGRPESVLARLEVLDARELPTDERVLLRARAFYALGDYRASAAAAESNAAAGATLLAVGALALANTGDHRRAAELIARAAALADATSRDYVTVVAVLVAALGDAELGYDQLIERVPDGARNNPRLTHLLGDVAMSRERYSEAVAWYETRTNDPSTAATPASMHALALGTALVALAVQRLPLGEATLRDTDGRALAERGRALLESLRTAATLESVGARASLLGNLAIAASLLDEPDVALTRAREAIDAAPQDPDMWQRWLGLALRLRRADAIAPWPSDWPDEPEVLLRAAAVAQQLARDDTRALFERVLQHMQASAEQRSRARVALWRLDSTEAISDDVLEAACAELGHHPYAAAEFLLEHLPDPSLRSRRRELALQIATAAATQSLSINEAIGIAALLNERGHALEAAPLLKVLRETAMRDQRIDPSVTDLLIDVLLANGRLSEAERHAAAWFEARPHDADALANRTWVLIARGATEQAWEILATCIANPAARPSIGMLEQFAQISVGLGRVRRAHRIVAASVLPTPRQAAGFRALLHALTLLKDRRVDDILLLGTQPELIEASTSGAVYALAIRQRRPAPRIEANTAVILRDVRGGEQQHLWFGPAAPTPGVGVAPVAFETPWLDPARGKTLGDVITFSDGPFAGRTYTVQSIRHAHHLLVQHAEAVALAAGLEQGGIASVSEPSIDQLVVQMREQLDAHQAFARDRLALARSRGIPAVAVAAMFAVSPRELLQTAAGSRPDSGPGTEELINADSEALNGAGRLVLDPATLLLIALLSAERLGAALPERFVITPQTVSSLRYWYLIERDAVRARAMASAGPRGTIRLREWGAADRRLHWRAWRYVRTFVRAHCEVIEPGDDDLMARTAPLLSTVDAGTLSAMALAAERDWAYVAEEFGARRLASHFGVRRTSSLQRLIAVSGELHAVPRRDAVRWLARLIELGWQHVVLPFWTFGVATRLPISERRRVLKQLMSTLTAADPFRAVPALLGFLVAVEGIFHESGRRRVKLRWLRRLVLRYLPPGTALLRKAALTHINEVAPGRTFRALRRAVMRWVKHEPRQRSSGGA